MKTKSLIIIAASFGLLGGAQAQDEKKERPHRKLPPEVIEKFDKDGDGKLSEEEREAMREERKAMMEARKKEMLEKFDKDGDGKLNDAEKEEAKAFHKAKMLEKFDKDKDGELSDEEKAEMRKEMGPRGGGPRDGKGKGPRGPKAD